MKSVISRLTGLFIIVFLVVINAVLIGIFLDNHQVQGFRLFTGITGIVLIILSFAYSMRKRKWLITFGSPKYWLLLHEWLSIGGTFLIFVHTGTHFSALVPVITLICMFTAFISGLAGRYVYNDMRAALKEKRKGLENQGVAVGEIEQNLWSLAVTSSALSKWRALHRPIVLLLALMVLYHAVSALYYRGF